MKNVLKARESNASTQRGAASALALLFLLVWAGNGALAEPTDSGFRLELQSSVSTVPSPPSRGVLPVQLVLDDGSVEGTLGASQQFLFFNRFTNPGGMELAEIWVLFPSAGDASIGDDVQLVVYLDPDSNPSNGATLLASYDVTVQAVDGATFSVFPLGAPLPIDQNGDILIGVVNRYHETGVDPTPTVPAALDTTSSQSRSYVALWAADPPSSPDLATADSVDLLAGASAGNLMIRGFGTAALGAAIPTLGGIGLGLLVGLIAAAGVLLQRTRA